MTFREINKILKADNWELIREIDSCHQYRKVGIPDAIVIPDHNGHNLTIGIIKELEKKTGLTLES